MHDADEFLTALTIVLCVAAVTTVVFQLLHQPVVLGYVIAGLIIGPHLPVPLVADPEIVDTLSELGVILLMFSLGLEFSVRRLVRVGPTAGVTAVVQCSVMMWLGFIVGKLLGWTTTESLFAGAIIAISSTTIIAKVFDEQGVSGKLREIVVGVLVVEDLIAILLMATLTAVSSGTGLSAEALVLTVGRLAAFLAGLLVVGLLVVPRLMRFVVRIGRPETTLVASVGICFAGALLAAELGYSVALGAFLAGSLIADSGEQEQIEPLIRPVRDVFAAIFFVSVGMLIDPALLAEHWLAVVILTFVVIAGKVVSVALGAFLTGNGTRTSIQAGMSLAQIGEFSFIIAGLGVSLGATRGFLFPVAVAVSAVTTLTTPWLIRAAPRVASAIDARLPRPLQTFVTLYGSWLDRLRESPRRTTARPVIRRLLGLLLLDGALLAAVIIAMSFAMGDAARLLREHTGLRGDLGLILVVAGTMALTLPFWIGVFRIARRLALVIAERALPPVSGGRVDLAGPPRTALIVTLQLAFVLLVGLPVLAITQPFVDGVSAGVVLLLAIAVLGVAFWRSAAHLHGHARAGAHVIVEALAAQSAEGAPLGPPGHELDAVHALLPGLGEPEAVRVEASSEAVGKSFADLDLRGRTGATALAVMRTGGGVVIPDAKEVLRAGDVVALAGTQESIDAARAVLRQGCRD